MEHYLGLFAECWPSLLSGLGTTIFIAAASLFFAFFLGIILAVMGLSPYRPLKAVYHFYIYLVRGVPVMIFALFLFFGMGALLHLQFNPVFAAILTLTVNASAYLAEIFRGGIQAVDQGQVEAARSLGLGHLKTLQKIVLPQAIKIMIPPIINQFITTLKDTSILSVISVRELTMNSQIIIAKNYMPFEVYSYAAIMYFIVIMALSLFARWVERRLRYDD